MKKTTPLWLFAAVLTALFLAGCTPDNDNAQASPAAAAGEPSSGILFLNVTTDGSDDAQRLDMALKLAGFGLDEERDVFVFFNVKGVHVPTMNLPDDFAYSGQPPIKDQLAKLIERGAEVHVCPICMKALGVEESDLVEGAQVTTRPKLFGKIGPDTAVFSY